MCCPEVYILKQVIINLNNQLKEASKNMYRIKLQDYKIIVVCKNCFEKGEVNKDCKQCGGRGTHNKTKQKWEVCKNKIYICKIDRDEKGQMRYWEDKSCFFYEKDKRLHFTYRDAVDECKRRNELIK
jgi:RecJ-like exonuclease